jgi:hypothetical protein
MKNLGRRLFSAFVIISTLNTPLSTVFAQGSLTPPGAPAPTMKTLDQIQPRTIISSAPFTITQPGSYYLTTNLSVNSGDAIDINTNQVTIDLNGFTISSTANPPTGYAINLTVSTGNQDIAIINGHIKGGVTNNGTTFGGSGFDSGINYSYYGAQNYPQNVRVNGVTVSGCFSYGIRMPLDPNNVESIIVESCAVQNCGGAGIEAQVVSRSTATHCGNYGIYANTASDCSGGSTTNGIGVLATIANNCHGSGGTGVEANGSANNCYGTGAGIGGIGVGSLGIANNCFGQDGAAGYGIYAVIVTGCYGSAGTGGVGIHASVANSSYSNTGDGGITHVYNMP